MTSTYYELVKENAIEREDLTARQDADVLLRNLKAYVMKSFDGKTPVEGVFNQTLNRPKVMSSFIIAALGNTSEQIIVETEERNLDTDYIKDFRRLAFAAANIRLLRQGLWELNPYLDEQSCIRGGAAARPLFRKVNDVLISDITYWDYRYVNYEIGTEGTVWASFGYGTKRKKAAIESEEWAKELKAKGKDKAICNIAKEAEIVDIWTPEHNEIWLDGKEVFEQPHPYKWPDGTRYCPVVIQNVPLGSMLSDKDDIKHQNESIFFLIREAIPELERLVTIIQTQAFLTLYPSIEIASKEGGKIDPETLPEYDKLMRPKAVSGADIGGGTRIISQGDANRAAMMAMERMDRNMNEGGFIPRQLDSPAPSGIALIIEKEGKDVIYLPRLKLKSSMKTALGDMFTAQVIQLGGTVEIGTPGHKREFETNKLKGQYEVTHKFSVTSLATNAGLASLAAAYGNLISDRAKRRDILQREDPDGDERWLSYEEARRTIPAIRFAGWAEDLIALEKDEYAKMIADFAGVQLEQLLSGNAQMPKPEVGKEPTQVLSLFGGGVGRGRRPKLPQESPAEEVGKNVET